MLVSSYHPIKLEMWKLYVYMWYIQSFYKMSIVNVWLRKMHEIQLSETGPRFNIKMTSYQYRKSHCGDKTILRPSYLHNGISYTGKMTSLYWIGAQVASDWRFATCMCSMKTIPVPAIKETFKPMKTTHHVWQFECLIWCHFTWTHIKQVIIEKKNNFLATLFE